MAKSQFKPKAGGAKVAVRIYAAKVDRVNSRGPSRIVEMSAAEADAAISSGYAELAKGDGPKEQAIA